MAQSIVISFSLMSVVMITLILFFIVSKVNKVIHIFLRTMKVMVIVLFCLAKKMKVLMCWVKKMAVKVLVYLKEMFMRIRYMIEVRSFEKFW